jgi:hypothetical protein
MNLMRKLTCQGRHDVVEYVLPTVSVPFPGVNFGMCLEHKALLVLSVESGVEKIVREATLFSNERQLSGEKQQLEIRKTFRC